MNLKVRVIPKAKKQRIENFNQGLKVYLTDPAIEGRANRKLIEVLAEYLKVKKYNISIVKGLRQRDKLIKVNENN